MNVFSTLVGDKSIGSQNPCTNYTLHGIGIYFLFTPLSLSAVPSPI